MGGAGHAVPVQDDDARLAARELRLRAADLRPRLRLRLDSEASLLRGVAHPLRQRLAEKRDAEDQDQDELDGRDRARDERRGPPRTDEGLGRWHAHRLLHRRRLCSPGPRTILPPCSSPSRASTARARRRRRSSWPRRSRRRGARSSRRASPEGRRSASACVTSCSTATGCLPGPRPPSSPPPAPSSSTR